MYPDMYNNIYYGIKNKFLSSGGKGPNGGVSSHCLPCVATLSFGEGEGA